MPHPYAEFARLTQKPSRYLGGEHGATRKDWDRVACRMCLAFPDVYEVGMSHLGFKILYSTINRQPDLLAERAFAPWFDMEAELRKRGQPLRSLESGRPLAEFDVVGFSLQFELTFTNILQMLELGGIPLRASDRRERDPLVLAGGPGASHPEPIAPFIDAFFLGDGEQASVDILRLWSRLQLSGLPRALRLERLGGVPGIYIPALYATDVDPVSGIHYVARARSSSAKLPVRRVVVADLDQYPFPCDGPVANTETVFDRASVEIARGCTEGCRFCQAGIIYRPVRERDPQHIIEAIRKLIETSGYETASLTSLSTADYSAITPLIRALTGEFASDQVSLVVSSLRAYGLDSEVLDDLRQGRATGLTFALEAGSQRLRDVINKNVTEEQLMETARRVFSCGWDKIKLYFMLGLPTEQEPDLLAMIGTAVRIRQLGRKIRGKRTEVVVNVSTHVPRPHTPFQWCAMDPLPEVERKQALLKREARRTGLTLRLHGAAGSFLEAVLARGDRTVADAVEAAFRAGARFDSWSERLRPDLWKSAFAQAGVDATRFISAVPIAAHLPWEHVATGVESRFLQDEYQKALAGRPSPPCGKPAIITARDPESPEVRTGPQKPVCYGCGVECDLKAITDRRRRGPIEIKPRSERPIRAPVDPSKLVRIRLGFRKLGPVAYLSHLDLIRTLPRLCRRIGLRLQYSQGFHPKALMSLGPALSVGIFSLSEYVDVTLDQNAECECESLPEKLSAAAPEGLSFFAARELSAGDAKLSRVIDEAVYVAGIERSFLEQVNLTDMESLGLRLKQRQDGDLKIARVIDGAEKIIDVAEYLMQVSAGQGAEALEQAELYGNLVPITLRLRVSGGGAAKVSEALDALLGTRETPARFVRAALLWTRDGVRATPMDLEALRSRPAPLDPQPSEAR